MEGEKAKVPGGEQVSGQPEVEQLVVVPGEEQVAEQPEVDQVVGEPALEQNEVPAMPENRRNQKPERDEVREQVERPGGEGQREQAAGSSTTEPEIQVLVEARIVSRRPLLVHGPWPRREEVDLVSDDSDDESEASESTPMERTTSGPLPQEWRAPSKPVIISDEHLDEARAPEVTAACGVAVIRASTPLGSWADAPVSPPALELNCSFRSDDSTVARLTGVIKDLGVQEAGTVEIMEVVPEEEETPRTQPERRSLRIDDRDEVLVGSQRRSPVRAPLPEASGRRSSPPAGASTSQVKGQQNGGWARDEDDWDNIRVNGPAPILTPQEIPMWAPPGRGALETECGRGAIRKVPQAKARPYHPRRHLTMDDYVGAVTPPRTPTPPPGPAQWPRPSTSRGGVGNSAMRRGSEPRGQRSSGVGIGGPEQPRRPVKPVRLGGIKFEGLRPVMTDVTIDPPPYSCFNCWQPGHRSADCPRPRVRVFCDNCGRHGVDMADCPRCSAVHRTFVEKTYAHEKAIERELDRRNQESLRREAEIERGGPWQEERRRNEQGQRHEGRERGGTSKPVTTRRGGGEMNPAE